MEHPDPTKNRVLRELAANARNAGPIVCVALLLDRDSERTLFGPIGWDDDDTPPRPTTTPRVSLPDVPVCIVEPDQQRAMGLPAVVSAPLSFTLIPLRSQRHVLGALVFGHESHHAPTDAFLRAEALTTLGTHGGTKLQLREDLGSLETIPRGMNEPSTDALRSIAMVGRMASLGKIAGGLIHEINNPSTFIALAGGQIEKLASKGADVSESELGSVLEMATGIRESTQQIRDMVAAFRLLVGVTNRTTVVTVDLERVLESAVGLTRAAHRHDAVLETDFSEMPPCPGHFVELGSVVVNILVNAIESLRSSASAKTVRVRSRLRDGVIQVRICDTGEGIPEAVLPHVFDAFFSTRDPSEHAGLGLTVARETVAAFDGRILIESEVGKGTSVLVEVPFSHPHARFHSHPPSS
jgi:signal transduction histidine kinase